MFAPGQVSGYPDLTISNDFSVAEGTGVVVSSSVESCGWRLRVQEAGGSRIKSEWVRVFDRCDKTRCGRVAAQELLPHAEQLNLSACDGRMHCLEKLQNALPMGGLEDEFSFVTDKGLGLLETLVLEKSNQSDSSKPSCVNDSRTTNQVLQCSTQIGTSDGMRGRSEFGTASSSSSRTDPGSALVGDDWQRSTFLQTLGARSKSIALTVGLVHGSLPSFRNEVLACRNETNPSKIRGLGLAWRSDGLLLSHRVSAGGEPILWTGRSLSYCVGDVLDIVPQPLTESLDLFVNGRRAPSFLEGSLPLLQPYRLAVRLERACINIESRLGQAVAARTHRQVPKLSESFPARVLPQDINSLPEVRREAMQMETLRDHHYRTSQKGRKTKPTELSGSAPKSWAEYWPPTFQPGLGVKLATQRSDREQRLSAALSARVKENAAQRCASARSRCERDARMLQDMDRPEIL